MSKHRRIYRLPQSFVRSSVLTLTVLGSALSASAGDWNAIPSTFTHDPSTGQRTNQYQREAPAFRPAGPPVIRSGYRQVRDSLSVGGISDNSHYVERFGEPVQPYGEWRFPYRPYSSPYQAWGPPVPQSLHLGNQFGGGGFGGAGYGGGYRGGAGHGGGGYGGHMEDGVGDAGRGGRFRRGVDPRRLPIPATPDRWRPWHDGGYPDLPRDYYQTAPEPYWRTGPIRRPTDGR